MKTTDVSDFGDQSCSCTSCLYRSESDCPSLRRIISHGSRIDRLYYGKYIPLRERKLLEKLVRTRGVYDNIKAQLLSSSTISIDRKSVFKPQRKLSVKRLNDQHDSNTILELVDLVDRGEKLDTKELSGCCSCCSCSSKFNLHMKSTNKRRPKRAYHGGYRQIHTREKNGENRKRGVRFKTKHIKSDPCTCTFKFSGMLKNSNAKLKKMRAYHPPTFVDLMPTTDDEINQKHKGHLTRSIENLRRSKTQVKDIMMEGVRKLSESKTKIKEKINLHTKESLEKLNKVKNNIQSKINVQKKSREVPNINNKNNNNNICECPEIKLIVQTRKHSLNIKNIMMEGVRKLSESKTKIQEKINLHTKESLEKINKIKNNIKSKINVKRKSREITKNKNVCECPKETIISQIRKDSLNKFKDDLKRKRILKDWECDSDCIEGICFPEECYYKLKQIGSRHLKAKYDQDSKGSITMQDRMIKEPLINPSITIQSKQAKFVSTVVDKQKPTLRVQETRQVTEPLLTVSTNKELKKSKKVQKDINKAERKKLHFFCKCKSSKYKTQNVKSGSLVRPTTPVIKNKIKDRNVSPPRERGIHIHPNPKLDNIRPESRQQVVRIGSSFTFNIEFYKNKPEPSQNISQVRLQRLPKYSTQSLIKHNNERFAKNTNIKTVNRRQRGSQIKLEHPKKTTKTGEDNFKRCICPLKFKYNKRNKFKKAQATKEKSLMALNSFSDPCTPAVCTISKKCNLIDCQRRNQKLLNNVETNTYYAYSNVINIRKRRQKKIKDKQSLLPYECEPGVCVPDSCDPYECIKLISARKAKSKQRSVQCECSAKSSGRNKSTSSLNTRIPKSSSLKPKFAKSLISHKNGKFKNKLNKIKNMKSKHINNASIDRNGRQFVRIGSTFSFNLEFHKTKSPRTLSPFNFKRISNETHPSLYKETSNRKSVKITPVNKNWHRKTGIGTTLKKCFCTLKLQDKKNIKTKRKKILTSGTDFVNVTYSNVVITSNKSTRTKNKRPLLAMECEPFVCIPGACDPYDCLERINKRYKHLKETGSITEHPENKSVSSTTYSKKSLKTVNVQSNKPFSKNRKSLAKPKNISSNLKYTPGGKANQAVKIGSSFNFNIEFTKTNTPIKDINSKLQMNQTFHQHSIKDKRKKRKMNKLNVANVTTQVKGERKLPKASMADHFVKRCFCTLNLQKYRKRQPFIVPTEYTINRAITGLNLKDKIYSLNYIQSNNSPGGPSVVRMLSKSSSLNSLDVEKWTSSFSFIENRMVYLKQMKMTNLNQYVRQCFCTMNLQLVNKNISNKKPKSANPFSTGKNTLKNNKEPSKSDRSSVRVGSTFSFNIDFSKNTSSSSKGRKYVDNLLTSKYSSDTELGKQKGSKSKKIKTIGTRKTNITYNRQSQSATYELANKASATAPGIRRCFCTLKLQKKGRWYGNVHAMKNNKIQFPNTINQSLSKVTTVNRAQNTAFKPLNLAHSLKPYECEPNICTPGYCDPYQCLEIMKRRKFYKHTKESGIGTIQTKKTVSSLTVGNLSIGTQKKLKIRPKQNEITVTRKNIEPDNFEPSRQVVRVGSSFSFNIEFSKDQSAGVQNITNNFKERKQVTKIKHLPELKKRQKDQITPQNSNFVRDKDTEIKNFPRIASTMTPSFRERCFCIAQLKDFKKQSVDMHLKNKPTFLKKCLCFFKSFKTGTPKNEGIHFNKAPRFDKKMNTQKVTMLDQHQLYPYECEPGICIPGKCNPYECYEILKRRKHKTKSKASTTAEIKNVRSIYSNSDKLRMKNVKTQLRNRQKGRHIEKKSFSQPYLKDSNRNVVKIGSNFSFNIEFYKDKVPKYDMSIPLQQLHLKSKENIYKEKSKKIIKNERVTTRTQRSQIDLIRKRDHSTESKQFLKRCFCTLQLHNKYSNIPKVQVKGKKKNQGIKLSTKSVMTKNDKYPLNIPKFFECEPDICVPYQCDPYECEKIMELRRKQKDSTEVGSLTKGPKKYTVSSATKPLKKSKHETQTIVNKNYNKISHYNDKYKESRSKQKVKIGSSFEFNIEFYKNKNNLGFEMSKQPKLTNIKSKLPTNEKIYKSKGQTGKYKQVKFKKSGSKTMKSQSTMMDVSPHFKRHKTLFFKKPKPKKHITLKNITSSIGTETQKQLAHISLLPYECEPQTCIPGECNSIECLERIKRRHKNFGGTTKFLHKTNNVSTITAGKAKSKTRKNQFESPNKDELRSKKETSANSKKQAVRIGSSFHFNIEFYKDRAEPYTVSKQLNNIQKLHGGNKKSEFKVNQVNKPLKTKSQLTRTDNPILKRCFCMLKLQKQACVVSNCLEFKAHSLQTKEQKSVHKTGNKNKIDKKIRTLTFLKKCLCVFKIRKIDRQEYTTPYFNSEIIKQQITPRRLNRNISTQDELLPFECEPNVCLPGKCDPYECEKRIRKRILQRSNISKQTATDKIKLKSMNLQGPKKKMQKHKQTLYLHTKSNHSDSDFHFATTSERNDNKNSAIRHTKQSLPERNSMIDNTNLNKQAVKIGSNVSFNIEFYKQTSPKMTLSRLKNSQKLSKVKKIPMNGPTESVYNKNISTKSAFIRNHGSQAKGIKTEDKTMEVQNTPNRCFCTLKLQKNVHSRYREKNVNSRDKSPLYPQILEIRRVAVQHKRNRPKKTHSTVRSVATRINEKYMKEKKKLHSPPNICPCKSLIISSTEMETILPYTPAKFKKTSSKKLLSVQNKFLNKNKIQAVNKTSQGKKLNKKKSKRNINYNKLFSDNKLKEKSASLKEYFCRCTALFTRKPKNNNLMNNITINRKNDSYNNDEMYGKKPKPTCKICFENIRSSKSDRKPMRQFLNQNTYLKKSKSLKIDDKCDTKCIKYHIGNLRGDQKRNRENNTIQQTNNPQQASKLKSAKVVPDAEFCSCNIKAHSKQHKQRYDEIICDHCQKKTQEKLRKGKGKSSPPKVHFDDVTSNANFLDGSPNFKKYLKSDEKYLKLDRNNEKRYKYYEYCSSCGRKINKLELQKGAGDHLINENKKISPKHHNKRIKDIFKLNRSNDNVCSGEYRDKPLFEMQLKSDNYDIINKEEVIDNVTKLSNKSIKDKNKSTKSHKKSCRCCVCLFKQNKTGAHIHVAAKGSKICSTLGNLICSSKVKKPTSEKPCTCGSYICSKKNQDIKTEPRKMKKNKNLWKSCVCGSPICDRESAIMRKISSSPDKIKCICKQEHEKIKKKIKAKKDIKEAKDRAIFLKKYSKEDRIRRKKRRKEEKEMEKRINKKGSDLVLAAESAIDIGKLGITACTDILRAVARCAADPKQAYNTLKAMKENPKLIERHFKSAYDDSGVAATARRVRLRCLAMRGVKKVKNTLERYAITNFLLHIADKDPKSRIPKPYKPKRVRERLDFGCSLYMASLRKRPFLSIYDRCPWFYPHFLSLVNVWKQFVDITLFLLAVAVWSPCILCMEVCRAMMCCFFCTG